MAFLGERIKWGKWRVEDELRLINTDENKRHTQVLVIVEQLLVDMLVWLSPAGPL